LVRPECIEETADDRRYAGAQCELAGDSLGGQLGDAVDVEGTGGMLLPQRPICDGIDRRGAGHEGLLDRTARRAGIQHVDRTGHIHIRSLNGVRIAVRDEMDGGQVQDPIRTASLERPAHGTAIADVHFQEPLIGHRGELAAAEAEVVHHPHFAARVGQSTRQRRADEARAPCDQDPFSHGAKVGGAPLRMGLVIAGLP